MTRKDYELITRTIRQIKESAWGMSPDAIESPASFRKGIMAVAFGLAAKLKDENPRFDKAKFLSACDLYSEDVK